MSRTVAAVLPHGDSSHSGRAHTMRMKTAVQLGNRQCGQSPVHSRGSSRRHENCGCLTRDDTHVTVQTLGYLEMSRVATLVEYVSGRAFRSLVSRHVAAKSDGPCHLSVQSARSHRGELAKPASLRAPLVVIPAKQKTLTPRLEDLPGVGKLQFLFFAAFILAFASPASEARIPVRCSIHRCSDTNASYGGRAPVLSTISLFFSAFVRSCQHVQRTHLRRELRRCRGEW